MKNISAKSVFGNKLLELRQANGLTQPQLAVALNVSRDTIAYYETKAHNPTSDFIQKVADYFNVPYDHLLDSKNHENKKPGPASKIEKQLEAIRKLPKKDQHAISAVLDMALKEAK